MGTASMTSMLRLGSDGRGRNYSPSRGFVESTLRCLYVGGGPARAWSRFPGATRVRCEEIRLPLPGARGTPPLCVVFASDLHLGPTTPSRTLDNAFELLRRAEPDVLVLGGDYVFLDATPAVADELARRIEGVPARTKVAALGNHDLWTQHDVIEAALARAGVHVLVNDAVRLPPPHNHLAVLGLDDPWTGTPEWTARWHRPAMPRSSWRCVTHPRGRHCCATGASTSCCAVTRTAAKWPCKGTYRSWFRDRVLAAGHGDCTRSAT